MYTAAEVELVLAVASVMVLPVCGVWYTVAPRLACLVIGLSCCFLILKQLNRTTGKT